jgi:hypothetical protein
MYRLGAYFTALAASEAAAEGRLLAVALDGKTLRGARRAGAAAAHLVSVFAHRARLVLVSAPAATVPFAPRHRCTHYRIRSLLHCGNLTT